MLAVEFRKGSFDFPDNCRSIGLGRNRKKGRPANTKKALEFQDDGSDDEVVYSDTGEEDNEIEYQQTQTQTKKYSKRRKDDTEDESSYDLFSVEEALPQLTLEQLTDEESLYSLELTDEEQPKKQTPMKQTSKKSPKKKRAYKKSKLVVSQKTPKKRTLRSRK